MMKRLLKMFRKVFAPEEKVEPPPRLFEDFLNLCQRLSDESVEYIIIGGFAVVLHGFNRTTEDIDLFVKLEKDNVDRFRKILADLFHDNDALKITTQNLDQNAVIRYFAPTGTQIDVMVRQGEKIEFSDINFETKTVHDVEIKVATPESLLKMKGDSLRPKDQVDIHFFKQIIDERKNACSNVQNL